MSTRNLKKKKTQVPECQLESSQDDQQGAAGGRPQEQQSVAELTNLLQSLQQQSARDARTEEERK